MRMRNSPNEVAAKSLVASVPTNMPTWLRKAKKQTPKYRVVSVETGIHADHQGETRQLNVSWMATAIPTKYERC